MPYSGTYIFQPPPVGGGGERFLHDPRGGRAIADGLSQIMAAQQQKADYRALAPAQDAALAAQMQELAAGSGEQGAGMAGMMTDASLPSGQTVQMPWDAQPQRVGGAESKGQKAKDDPMKRAAAATKALQVLAPMFSPVSEDQAKTMGLRELTAHMKKTAYMQALADMAREEQARNYQEQAQARRDAALIGLHQAETERMRAGMEEAKAQAGRNEAFDAEMGINEGYSSPENMARLALKYRQYQAGPVLADLARMAQTGNGGVDAWGQPSEFEASTKQKFLRYGHHPLIELAGPNAAPKTDTITLPNGEQVMGVVNRGRGGTTTFATLPGQGAKKNSAMDRSIATARVGVAYWKAMVESIQDDITSNPVTGVKSYLGDPRKKALEEATKKLTQEKTKLKELNASEDETEETPAKAEGGKSSLWEEYKRKKGAK